MDVKVSWYHVWVRIPHVTPKRLNSLFLCELSSWEHSFYFVNCWKCHQEVLRPNKYNSPMALSWALSDDSVHRSCWYYLLFPHLNPSAGRQLLFWKHCDYTREGYTSESLVSTVHELQESYPV